MKMCPHPPHRVLTSDVGHGWQWCQHCGAFRTHHSAFWMTPTAIRELRIVLRELLEEED